MEERNELPELSAYYWLSWDGADVIIEVDVSDGRVYSTNTAIPDRLEDLAGLELVGPIPYPVRRYRFGTAKKQR